MPIWTRYGFRTQSEYRRVLASPEFRRAEARERRLGGRRVGLRRGAVRDRALEAIGHRPWVVTERHSRRGREVYQVVVHVFLSDGSHHSFAIEFDNRPTFAGIRRAVPREYASLYPENSHLRIRSWRIVGEVHLIP